jgi:hypothetical protein
MAKKLVSYSPELQGFAHDCVDNQVCELVVTDCCGVDSSYSGRVSSVRGLVRSLRRRLMSDSSIAYVCVYSPARHLVCSVGWHYCA